ncbi:MAG: type II secretion system F family protein [Planctomycetota bacterium]
MPVFQYQAIDRENRPHNGVIDSDSARQAREELRSLGFRVSKIVESTPKLGLSIPIPFRPSWGHWVASFCSELATLLSVDVPLVESLMTLRQQYKRQAEAVVLRLKDEVATGQSLAAAMKHQPDVFDELCIKMVEVGENTGRLDEVLRQVADFKQRSLAFRDRVLSSLLYPAILLSVSIAVSVFLMTVVVPMLLENLKDSGQELPWPTMMLQAISGFLVSYGWVLLILLIVDGFLVAITLRTEWGRRLRDRVLLKIPVIGKMSRQQEIARVALIVATLLKSGIKFVQTINIAIGSSKNELLKDALRNCATQVQSGKEIGASLGDSSYFPPLVTQIFSVGQESGQLEEMLFRLSKDYDRQVESTAGRLSTIVEPVLILLLSVFIGFIMFATLMPILEAGNVL